MHTLIYVYAYLHVYIPIKATSNLTQVNRRAMDMIKQDEHTEDEWLGLQEEDIRNIDSVIIKILVYQKCIIHNHKEIRNH